MAKRVVQECDLTKQEYDPEDTVTITFKKAGKAKGRSYDLSPEAAAKLEQQLVGGNELPATWGFGSVAKVEHTEVQRARTTLADLENDPLDDTELIASKKAQFAELGGLDKNREEPTSPVIAPSLGQSVANDKCLHMNKGPIQTTIRDKKRHAYRTCRECRKEVPVKSKSDNESYMNASLPSDVNMRDRS